MTNQKQCTPADMKIILDARREMKHDIMMSKLKYKNTAREVLGDAHFELQFTFLEKLFKEHSDRQKLDAEQAKVAHSKAFSTLKTQFPELFDEQPKS